MKIARYDENRSFFKIQVVTAPIYVAICNLKFKIYIVYIYIYIGSQATSRTRGISAILCLVEPCTRCLLLRQDLVQHLYILLHFFH